MTAKVEPIRYEHACMRWKSYERYLVESRYAVRDEQGKPLEHSYDDIANRVANAWLRRVHELCETDGIHARVGKAILKLTEVSGSNTVVSHLTSRAFIPNTPLLINLGSPCKNKCYFACFPLGSVEDSMEDIMNTAKLLSKIYKGGGGCGVDLSKLRQKGALIDNAQGIASGPVSFMYLYGAVTGVIEQGGRRRGALMVQLDDSHPDWELFVKSKTKISADSPLNNMNISLNVWDWNKFCEEKKIDLVAECAWACGDPGLFYMENALKLSPIPASLKPFYSNPCAEYLSIAKTACNLVTVNPVSALRQATTKSSRTKEELMQVLFTHTFNSAYNATLFASAVVFFDEGYPDDEIREKTQQYRPTGIGLTGLHHIMAILGIPYDSDEAVELTRQIFAHLLAGTLVASYHLAEETGVITTSRVERLIPDEVPNLVQDRYRENVVQAREFAHKNSGLFNIVTTTQMPSGSTSQFAWVTATGIEPLWDIPTTRYVRDDDTWKQVSLWPLEVFNSDGSFNHQLYERLANETALNIPIKRHLDIVAAVQHLCHTGVSKTVNLPHDATIEDVKRVFEEAYRLGLKSISVYRDGSKQFQTLKTKHSKRVNTDTRSNGSTNGSNSTSHKRKRIEPPPVLEGRRYALTNAANGSNKLYVIVNRNGNNRPCEVFISIGKAGTVLNGLAQALGRCISVGLQYDHNLTEEYIKTLKNIDTGTLYTLHLPDHDTPLNFKSIPDAIAGILTLELQLSEQTACNTSECNSTCNQNSEHTERDICPSCGMSQLVRTGGCKMCRYCGYTTC